MDWIKNNIAAIKEVLFFIICWISGAISIRIGVNHIDFTQPDKIDRLFLIFLAVGLLLILLPFFKKVKFGSVELEREIQQTKKEVSDLRTEVRQQLSVLSTNLNTIGNLSNQVKVFLPGAQEIKHENTVITSKLGDKSKEVEDISDELILPYEDKVMSLAQTRIRIEYLLRLILEKSLTYKNTNRQIKFLTLSQLIRQFYDEYPQYRYMTQSFEYVNKISTAAIHAQNLEEKQVNEVLQLGATLIASLNDISSTVK